MIPRNRIPAHPGVILAEQYLRPLGLTQVDFASHIGVSVQRINEIVRGKRGVTPDTAWLFAQALDTTPEFWDASVAVNIKHQFFTAQAVLPDMKAAGGGSIVNFGSISWMLKQGGMPAYTASKAAAQGLTRCLARDLGVHRIRVNTLVPGWVMTEKQLKLWVTDETKKEIAKGQCIDQPLMPQHIASMALFLAADDSAMCTAQDFVVDGGWA